MMPLPPDLTSLSLAVKMQSSKRTLRSHEIPVPQPFLTSSNSVSIGTTVSAPPSLTAYNMNNTSFGSLSGNAFFETDLDLHFSLQYPHFIKRDGNRFVILYEEKIINKLTIRMLILGKPFIHFLWVIQATNIVAEA